jgi:hypothetical protein
VEGLQSKEGLVDAGLLEGIMKAVDGLLMKGRLDGELEALVGFLTAIPYEYSGIIECKHTCRLLSTTYIHNLPHYFLAYR